MHQSGAALRPWPLPPSSNASGFTLSPGWMSSASLRHAINLKRQVDIRTSGPRRPSFFSCKSPCSQPRACHSVEPPCAVVLSPNFPPLFHLQRLHHLLPVYSSGDIPLAIGFGIFIFLWKSSRPRRRTSTHYSRCLPRSSVETLRRCSLHACVHLSIPRAR